jgi:hypothetical protein
MRQRSLTMTARSNMRAAAHSEYQRIQRDAQFIFALSVVSRLFFACFGGGKRRAKRAACSNFSYSIGLSCFYRRTRACRYFAAGARCPLFGRPIALSAPTIGRCIVQASRGVTVPSRQIRRSCRHRRKMRTATSRNPELRIVNFLTDSPTAAASNILAGVPLGAQTRHLSGAERAKNC